ncbi:MAG: hypothetical protein CMJ78_26600 [Planctomycetaceae bacterium]|nr:hypothetical protein [Planctomycetaceae bacterium]
MSDFEQIPEKPQVSVGARFFDLAFITQTLLFLVAVICLFSIFGVLSFGGSRADERALISWPSMTLLVIVVACGIVETESRRGRLRRSLTISDSLDQAKRTLKTERACFGERGYANGLLRNCLDLDGQRFLDRRLKDLVAGRPDEFAFVVSQGSVVGHHGLCQQNSLTSGCFTRIDCEGQVRVLNRNDSDCQPLFGWLSRNVSCETNEIYCFNIDSDSYLLTSSLHPVSKKRRELASN